MLILLWDVGAPGDTESTHTHTTYTDNSLPWSTSICICECPLCFWLQHLRANFVLRGNKCRLLLCDSLTSLCTLKRHRNFQTKSIKERKKSSALSEEYIYSVSLCCIHNYACSAEVTRASGIHCLLHMCEECEELLFVCLFLYYSQEN